MSSRDAGRSKVNPRNAVESIKNNKAELPNVSIAGDSINQVFSVA